MDAGPVRPRLRRSFHFAFGAIGRCSAILVRVCGRPTRGGRASRVRQGRATALIFITAVTLMVAVIVKAEKRAAVSGSGQDRLTTAAATDSLARN